MESDLVFPVLPHNQELNVLEVDDSQPYLEAKLYIERMAEENSCINDIPKDKIKKLPNTDGSETLEPGVTMFPIRVPSTNFTSATVQWDMPESPNDDLSPDSSPVDELNLSYGVSVDWVVNPLSPEISSLNQEDNPNFKHKEDPELTDSKLHQWSAISENGSCQISDTQVDNVNKNMTSSSNEDSYSQLTETSADLKDSETTGSWEIDGIKDPLCIDVSEIQSIIEHPKVIESQNLTTETAVQNILTESDLALEDNEDEDAELILENKNDRVSVIENDTDIENSTTELVKKSETILDLEHTIQNVQLCPDFKKLCVSDPEELKQLNKSCVSKQLIEEVELQKVELVMSPPEHLVTERNSESLQKVKLPMDIDHETLELQQTETPVDMQDTELEINQWEPVSEEILEPSKFSACKEQVEYSVKMERSESLKDSESSEEEIKMLDTEQILEETNQFEYLPEVVCTAQPGQSESLNYQELCKQSLDPQWSLANEKAQLSESTPNKQKNNLEPLQETEQKTREYEHLQSQDEDHVNQIKASSHDTYEVEEQPQGETKQSPEPVEPVFSCNVKEQNNVVDREEACRLAERLYRLENIQRTDVVRHLDKDTEFSRIVGEEYLKFFDFSNQSLDEALRSFLKEVVLIGETQERERVLDRFAGRYQQCNPDTYSSSGAVLTLTCAVMLLNTDLHGQNVGKAMSLTDFISNLEGMNEGENFTKDLLKALYNSIKCQQIEWAIEEKELINSMSLELDSDGDELLRSKSNPFQNIPHDKKATVFQKGFLKRKAHADIDGKRTPWGKRSWKTFYAVLKGMVLYLQKDEYRKDWQSSEEVVSIHHSLAEPAQDYTKRPHVFRLQTADWRVFLFEAASTELMNLWIGRLNLVSALYSSPPFPAAVGSQKRFCRPILPASQSTLTVEKQLQSHAAMLHSFQEDLSALQQGAQESRRARTRELEEYRQREEYLQHEVCRYEAYVRMLEVWQTLEKPSEAEGVKDLALFDKELWKGLAVEEQESAEMDEGIKRSHSSPSLELEIASPPVVKVRRNISERRTYRKIVIPRRNKEL